MYCCLDDVLSSQCEIIEHQYAGAIKLTVLQYSLHCFGKVRFVDILLHLKLTTTLFYCELQNLQPMSIVTTLRNTHLSRSATVFLLSFIAMAVCVFLVFRCSLQIFLIANLLNMWELTESKQPFVTAIGCHPVNLGLILSQIYMNHCYCKEGHCEHRRKIDFEFAVPRIITALVRLRVSWLAQYLVLCDGDAVKYIVAYLLYTSVIAIAAL